MSEPVKVLGRRGLEWGLEDILGVTCLPGHQEG